MVGRLVDYQNDESDQKDHHQEPNLLLKEEEEHPSQPSLDTTSSIKSSIITDPHPHPSSSSIPNEALTASDPNQTHDLLSSLHPPSDPNQPALAPPRDPGDVDHLRSSHDDQEEEMDQESKKTDQIDADLLNKLRRFRSLREQGIYFNENLIQSKSYRNPNIYAKLVEFLNVQETSTNFDRKFWDPLGFPNDAFADALREQQKTYSESKQQSNGKRTTIGFERPTTYSSGSGGDQVTHNTLSRKDRPSDGRHPPHHHHHHHHHNGDRGRRDRDHAPHHPRRRDRSLSPPPPSSSRRK